MIGNDFITTLAVYTPLTLGVALVIAAFSEREIRKVGPHALRLWAKILVISGFMLLWITIAQDPELIL